MYQRASNEPSHHYSHPFERQIDHPKPKSWGQSNDRLGLRRDPGQRILGLETQPSQLSIGPTHSSAQRRRLYQ